MQTVTCSRVGPGARRPLHVFHPDDWLAFALNPRPVLWVAALMIALGGCSSGDEDNGPPPSEETREARREATMKIIGEPTEAALLDGIAILQYGVDQFDREEVVASEPDMMMVAVKVAVEEEDQTLVPSEYTLTVGENEAKPLGIAFGGKTNVFFSTEQLLDGSIELRHNDRGAVGQAGNERLNLFELPQPEVVFLYKVKYGKSVDFWHGRTDFRLKVATKAEWLEDNLPDTKLPEDSLAGTFDRDVELEVVEGKLVRGQLNGEDKELYVLQVNLVCPSEGFDLAARDVYLRGGNKRANQWFFEFDDEDMRVLAGSEYSDTTYDGTPVRMLNSGGVRLGTDGGTISMRVIFPDPPFESGLNLHFGSLDPVELIAADAALGEIRPAVADSAVRITRAPIVGKPVRVGYLEGKLPVLTNRKTGKIEPVEAEFGKRFLALKFEMPETDQKFVSSDYRLEFLETAVATPKYIAVGKLPAEPVAGDPYQAQTILRDEEDRAELRRGELFAWHSSVPDCILVYEVTVDASQFTFKHGETQLTIQPSTVPKRWTLLRPDGALDEMTDQ